MALRLGLIALATCHLAGCAAWPAAVAVNLASQGAKGLAAMTLGATSAAQERSEERCVLFVNKGYSVTESLEWSVPANEGDVKVFEPAYWRPEFARDGYPEIEQSKAPVEVSLAISERAVLFLPAAGRTSVRIPYQLVQDVEVKTTPATGEIRYVVVKSCSGRFDIVVFRASQPDKVDAEATTAAAAQLKSRLTAFRAVAEN